MCEAGARNPKCIPWTQGCCSGNKGLIVSLAQWSIRFPCFRTPQLSLWDTCEKETTGRLLSAHLSNAGQSPQQGDLVRKSAAPRVPGINGTKENDPFLLALPALSFLIWEVDISGRHKHVVPGAQ